MKFLARVVSTTMRAIPASERKELRPGTDYNYVVVVRYHGSIQGKRGVGCHVCYTFFKVTGSVHDGSCFLALAPGAIDPPDRIILQYLGSTDDQPRHASLIKSIVSMTPSITNSTISCKMGTSIFRRVQKCHTVLSEVPFPARYDGASAPSSSVSGGGPT